MSSNLSQFQNILTPKHLVSLLAADVIKFEAVSRCSLLLSFSSSCSRKQTNPCFSCSFDLLMTILHPDSVSLSSSFHVCRLIFLPTSCYRIIQKIYITFPF